MTSSNRIQKLLFSEYADFEDMVLVESPFAQTTREGMGLRQVHIGLTPSKLILAADCLIGGETVVTSSVDPEIESLELISLFPVECVNISVFRRRTRNTLKAHFCNNQVLYFELAATQSRQMLWNLWMERVKFLCPEDRNSTQSETSVGSSTSSSTQYCKPRCKSTLCALPYLPKDQLVYQYKATYGDALRSEEPKPASNEINCCLKQSTFSSHSLRSSHSKTRRIVGRCRSMLVCCSTGRMDCCLVNRFGYGVAENCNMGLYLPGTSQRCPSKVPGSAFEDYKFNFEDAPMTNFERPTKHHRRYGIMPLPHLLFGLGPWALPKPQAYTLQAKEVMSEVQLRRPKNEEFRLCLSKRELTSTTSCEALYVDRDSTHALPATNKLNTTSDPPILFWTKDYWYRPRSAKCVYNDIINHLHLLNEFQNQKSNKKKGSLWKFRKKKSSPNLSEELMDEGVTKTCYSSRNSTNPMFALKRSLRMDIDLKIWEFDSNVIAYELTLIERDLFLKMRASDLVTLVQEKSSKNTPNVAAIIAFSNRMMNLVATEIVQVEDVKTRARLMARFINVVNKLHGLHNMQSARSILLGLQATAVYRMKKTWTYLRQHHSTKYQRLMFLLRLHKDPRTVVYKAMFQTMTCTPPYIPSVFYMVAYLLGKVSPKQSFNLPKVIKEELKSKTRMVSKEKVAMIRKQPLRYFMSSLRLCDTSESSSNGEEFSLLGTARSSETSRSSSVRVEHLKSLLWMPMCSCLEEGDAGWARLERLAALSDALATWQKSASQYALVDNSVAREYLLKARYLEDAELFYMSLKVEK